MVAKTASGSLWFALTRLRPNCLKDSCRYLDPRARWLSLVDSGLAKVLHVERLNAEREYTEWSSALRPDDSRWSSGADNARGTMIDVKGLSSRSVGIMSGLRWVIQ